MREVTSKPISHRHPLPLIAHSDSDSEAPNMFDVIDSLESGSRVESMHEKAGKMHTVSKMHRLELHCLFETCAEGIQAFFNFGGPEFVTCSMS